VDSGRGGERLQPYNKPIIYQPYSRRLMAERL